MRNRFDHNINTIFYSQLLPWDFVPVVWTSEYHTIIVSLALDVALSSKRQLLMASEMVTNTVICIHEAKMINFLR
jgi:hypothetical protein